MSERCADPPHEVRCVTDIDAWFCMLNSIVNFLSAASNLATKLEQNYLLKNVTTINRPPFPLLKAPTAEYYQELEENKSNTPQVIDTFCVEALTVPSFFAESDHRGECCSLPQEIKYANTRDMGDYNEDPTSKSVTDIEDCLSMIETEEDKTIKICSSEDAFYFEDDENLVNNVNRPIKSQGSLNQTYQNTRGSTSTAVSRNTIESQSFTEDKSIQAKTNSKAVKDKSKLKMKPSNSIEIQTSSTNRFKGTVRALITKSPELQQSIKENMITSTLLSAEKFANKEQQKPVSRRYSVPKNLNELRQQLDSITTVPSGKATQEHKEKSLPLCKVHLEKSMMKRAKKTESEPPNLPNTNTFSHVPTKSPGTSKRFASVESVVKKLINSPRATERKPCEHKCTKKPCPAMAKLALARRQTPAQEAAKQNQSQVTNETVRMIIEKKTCPLKENKESKSPQQSKCLVSRRNICSAKARTSENARSRSTCRVPGTTCTKSLCCKKAVQRPSTTPTRCCSRKEESNN